MRTNLSDFPALRAQDEKLPAIQRVGIIGFVDGQLTAIGPLGPDGWPAPGGFYKAFDGALYPAALEAA